MHHLQSFITNSMTKIPAKSSRQTRFISQKFRENMLKSAFQDITNISSKHIKLTIHKSAHRRKLLRWIYEVCRDFNYSMYTFTTTAIVIDRYTEKRGFELHEYQLIGVASLFLTAKIEESRTKKVCEYSKVTENTFSTKEIIEKEWCIIECLGPELYIKPPQCFFNPELFPNIRLSADTKRNILNCFIAAQLETRSYSRNCFLLFLESKREMEICLEKSKLNDAVRFYLTSDNAKAIEIN